MEATDKEEGQSPHYALYQRQVFRRGGQTGQLPNFSVHASELALSTRDKLNDRSYWYANSNAGLGWTDKANREAFYAWRIIPRMLIDTNVRDLSTTIFGHTIPAPILFAPIGINKLYTPNGELAPAKVAGELGLPYCLSTAASQPLEAVAAANDSGADLALRSRSHTLKSPGSHHTDALAAHHDNGHMDNSANSTDPRTRKTADVYSYHIPSSSTVELEDTTKPIHVNETKSRPQAQSKTNSNLGAVPDFDEHKNSKSPRFFQLYMGHDDDITKSLLNRAWNNGFDVLILTLDTWQLGWRPTDISIANYTFYYENTPGSEMGLSDPVFMRKYGEEQKRDSGKWIDSCVWHGKPHTWDKVEWVMKEWKTLTSNRPFVLKGIQSPSDAIRALELGVDGIVVSNHAGRQVDGAVGSLEILPDIVHAVRQREKVKSVAVPSERVGSAIERQEDYDVEMARAETQAAAKKKKRMAILFDSGIRTGSDVIKAIALGADAVLVGRLYIWGLSHEGESGCRHVMKSLLADLDITCTVAGIPSLEEIRGRKDKLLRFNPNGVARL